jgi:hypothetical protein
MEIEQHLTTEKVVKPVAPPISSKVSAYSPVKTVKDEKGSGIETEKKNQEDHVGRDKSKEIYDRIKFRDGGFRQYTVDLVSGDKVCQEVRRTLGFSDSEFMQNQTTIKEIAELAATFIQDDDVLAINKFISYMLRKTPSSGNRVFNLLRQIQIRFLDEQKG